MRAEEEDTIEAAADRLVARVGSLVLLALVLTAVWLTAIGLFGGCSSQHDMSYAQQDEAVAQLAKLQAQLAKLQAERLVEGHDAKYWHAAYLVECGQLRRTPAAPAPVAVKPAYSHMYFDWSMPEGFGDRAIALGMLVSIGPVKNDGGDDARVGHVVSREPADGRRDMLYHVKTIEGQDVIAYGKELWVWTDKKTK